MKQFAWYALQVGVVIGVIWSLHDYKYGSPIPFNNLVLFAVLCAFAVTVLIVTGRDLLRFLLSLICWPFWLIGLKAPTDDILDIDWHLRPKRYRGLPRPNARFNRRIGKRGGN